MLNDLNIEYLAPIDLKPRPNNPRTHTQKQIRQIARSIEKLGFNSPVLIDDESGIVAGHARVEAAKLLGLELIPAVRLKHLTKAQIRAYVIADNKLAQNAGWNIEILTAELKAIELELDIDLDVTITGFEVAEIDLLDQKQAATKRATEDDELPAIDDRPPVSRPGDLWFLGRHRLLCGNSTRREDFARLMGKDLAEIVLTDPPYNVPIQGHVSGLGKVKHAEFAMASGEMSEGQFIDFLQGVFQHLADFSIDGSLHYHFMDWRHMYEILVAGRAIYTEQKQLCVWNKSNGGMGSLYRNKHELVLVFKKGTAAHVNNVQLGRFGRDRTNVWDYAGANSFGADRNETLKMHPTVKPTELLADVLLDASTRGGIVLDCFGGSGATLLAAQKTERIARLIEMEPKFVDVTIERYRRMTGEEAVLAPLGESFSEVEAQRRAADAEAA